VFFLAPALQRTRNKPYANPFFFKFSTDTKSAELFASNASRESAECDFVASQLAARQLVLDTDKAKARSEDLALETETLRNE
jgi:hypothetical protein